MGADVWHRPCVRVCAETAANLRNVSGVVLRCESVVANAVFDVGREAVVAVRTGRVCVGGASQAPAPEPAPAKGLGRFANIARPVLNKKRASMVMPSSGDGRGFDDSGGGSAHAHPHRSDSESSDGGDSDHGNDDEIDHVIAKQSSAQSLGRVNSGRHSDSGGDDAGGKHAGAGGADDDEDGDHGDVTRAVSSRTASSGFRGRGPPSPELLKIVKRCMDSTNATPVLADTFTKSSKDDSKWIRFRWRQRYVVVGLGMFAWYAREGDVHSRGSRGLEMLQRVERLEPADIGGKRFAFDVRLLGRGGEGCVWWLVQGDFVDVWLPCGGRSAPRRACYRPRAVGVCVSFGMGRMVFAC